MTPNDAEGDVQRLTRLAEAGDIANLLDAVTPSQIATAWIRYHMETEAHRDQYWWGVAVWLSQDWWWHDRDRPVREAIDELIDQAGDDASLLEAIGTGPVEAYLDNVAGELRDGNDSRLRWLEDRLTRNTGWREAVAAVYPTVGHPEELWDRIDRLIGSRVTNRHPGAIDK